MANFKKPEANPLLNPIDFFNFYGTFEQIFEGDKKCISFSENEATYNVTVDGDLINKRPTFIKNKDNLIEVKKSNPFDIATGSIISKFMLLTAVKFKGDYQQAMSYVSFNIIKNDIPYIRVGTDYFKIINKTDRYSAINTILKAWDKSTIVEDHGKNLLPRIFKFNDFTIVPNNKTYIPTQNNCYNLYSKFNHTPFVGDVSFSDIPVTVGLMRHIFGEHFELGLKYLKILYEKPTQILPVLALVSTERETGKTTFLNYIQMLFGENSTLINPSDLMSSFNDAYATKNIIMVDETVIDKAHTVEKLKSLATAKSISVSQKFVQHYAVPFFGKIIVCTNKETDFMRIDEEEIRFWVRKINPINGKKNTNIENDLFNEIPKFLNILENLEEIDYSRSRMVFTQDEIKTQSLEVIKDESKSSLRKEIEYHLEDFFNNNTCKSFEATAGDIKHRWFQNNNQISIAYIRKVLKDEMKITVQKIKKYNSFEEYDVLSKTGAPFIFYNNSDQVSVNQAINIFEEAEPF